MPYPPPPRSGHPGMPPSAGGHSQAPPPPPSSQSGQLKLVIRKLNVIEWLLIGAINVLPIYLWWRYVHCIMIWIEGQEDSLNCLEHIKVFIAITIFNVSMSKMPRYVLRLCHKMWVFFCRITDAPSSRCSRDGHAPSPSWYETTPWLATSSRNEGPSSTYVW